MDTHLTHQHGLPQVDMHLTHQHGLPQVDTHLTHQHGLPQVDTHPTPHTTLTEKQSRFRATYVAVVPFDAGGLPPYPFCLGWCGTHGGSNMNIISLYGRYDLVVELGFVLGLNFKFGLPT